MPTAITFDPEIGRQFVRYAHMVAARGYIHNTLGNMAIRVRQLWLSRYSIKPSTMVLVPLGNCLYFHFRRSEEEVVSIEETSSPVGAVQSDRS